MRADITCFGKIIGGGLPVGAFGGRADVMRELAPEGPCYQAGTLSGNPLATAAGLAVLGPLRLWLVRAFRAGRGRDALINGALASLAVVAAFAVTEGVLHTRSWRSVIPCSPRRRTCHARRLSRTAAS